MMQLFTHYSVGNAFVSIQDGARQHPRLKLLQHSLCELHKILIRKIRSRVNQAKLP